MHRQQPQSYRELDFLICHSFLKSPSRFVRLLWHLVGQQDGSSVVDLVFLFLVLAAHYCLPIYLVYLYLYL